MSSIAITGGATGTGVFSLLAPSTSTNRTLTLPDSTGTLLSTASTSVVTPAMLTQPLTLGTAVPTTSGTSIDFTSIPSWAKRITVMFSEVSTNGSSILQIQLGDSGGVETTGYVGGAGNYNNLNQTSVSAISAGFQLLNTGGAGVVYYGNVVICLLSTNLWVASGVLSLGAATNLVNLAGTKTLSATLDRIRLTTVNGTDAFDAGSVNILYEG